MATGSPRAAGGAGRRRRAVRAGHDVVASVRRPDPRRPSGRLLLRGRLRRRRDSRKARSGALPARGRTAWRGPVGLHGDRGLPDRRRVRGRGGMCHGWSAECRRPLLHPGRRDRPESDRRRSGGYLGVGSTPVVGPSTGHPHRARRGGPDSRRGDPRPRRRRCAGHSSG